MRVPQRHYSDERQRRLLKRALPTAGGVLLVLILIVVVAGSGASPAVQGARGFAAAWERADYPAMYASLTDVAKRAYRPAAFAAAYRDAGATATVTGLTVGKTRDATGGASVAVAVRTRVFGTLHSRLELPMQGSKVRWSPRLAFPGVRPGEVLTRRSDPPRRAAILARDGKTLVSGPATARVPSAAGSAIAGGVSRGGTAAEQTAIYARGFPRDWPVGRGGLEAILESRVSGRPGGTLLAGKRPLARAASHPAPAIHTTIDVRLEAAAQSALAGRLGGVAVLDPRTGQVRALAGIAFSAPQPPGSTFKIITLAAALSAHVAKPSTPFPVASYALIDGVKLANANGESCGGSVAEGFVQSCNSVYAPLGVRVGSKRLVAMAERFGWNSRPPFVGAKASTIPSADQVGSKLALGSSAIGQGKVLATPLQMAMVAQAIAEKGVLRPPTILPGATPRPRRVVDAHTARTIEKLMLAVVARGTGTGAAIGSGIVAGKTGTAELESTTGPNAGQVTGQTSHTDAWFTAFAPAKHPRIAVGVMLYRAGAGGATAAPAARLVLQTALAHR